MINNSAKFLQTDRQIDGQCLNQMLILTAFTAQCSIGLMHLYVVCFSVVHLIAALYLNKYELHIVPISAFFSFRAT